VRRFGRTYAPTQLAKTTLFASVNETNVRKTAARVRRFGRTYAPTQLAKTTLFASVNETNVRKTAAGRFSKSKYSIACRTRSEPPALIFRRASPRAF
jgi:hypothetical protein